MSSRNRTSQYLRLREQFKGNRPLTSDASTISTNLHEAQNNNNNPNNTYSYISARNLLEKQGSEEFKQNVLSVPPDWMARVADVQYELSKIKSKLGDLAEQHKKHLLPGFDDRLDEEHAIEILTGEITKLCHQSQVKIKQIGSEEKLTPEQKIMKTNIQSTLASQLQELSVTFRSNQKAYLKNLQSRAKKGGFYKSDDSDLQDIDEERGLTKEQLTKIDESDKIITERERDILKIAKSINELAEIFNDMNILVIDQGTILDRIDYNLEQTEMYVDDGVIALQEVFFCSVSFLNILTSSDLIALHSSLSTNF